MIMSKRIQRKKKTIEAMLQIYCQAKHANILCEVHCYSVKRSNDIREIMRYSGPRNFYRHPFLSIGHLLDALRKAPSRPKPTFLLDPETCPQLAKAYRSRTLCSRFWRNHFLGLCVGGLAMRLFDYSVS